MPFFRDIPLVLTSHSRKTAPAGGLLSLAIVLHTAMDIKSWGNRPTRGISYHSRPWVAVMAPPLSVTGPMARKEHSSLAALRPGA